MLNPPPLLGAGGARGLSSSPWNRSTGFQAPSGGEESLIAREGDGRAFRTDIAAIAENAENANRANWEANERLSRKII